MHKIIYSNEAEQDLIDIVEYISLESHSNAIIYLNDYEKKIELLQHNPKMGTECNNKNIKKVCRVLRFKSHLIIYQEMASGIELFIVRIFHHRINYQEKI